MEIPGRCWPGHSRDTPSCPPVPGPPLTGRACPGTACAATSGTERSAAPHLPQASAHVTSCRCSHARSLPAQAILGAHGQPRCNLREQQSAHGHLPDTEWHSGAAEMCYNTEGASSSGVQPSSAQRPHTERKQTPESALCRRCRRAASAAGSCCAPSSSSSTDSMSLGLHMHKINDTGTAYHVMFCQVTVQHGPAAL